MTNDINAPPLNGLGGSVLFGQNYFSTAQVIVNQGGTSSGKTYAIEQVLFCLACQTAKLVITVVAQDIPNLKAGALRDALNIYQESEALQNTVKNFNKTDRLFEFNNGSGGHITTRRKQT
jgi:phage terminase large subunit